MGNAQPTNRTGKKATQQKLENAKKTGILSLSEHSLEEIPAPLYETELTGKLRTLDLSRNKLTGTGRLSAFVELKSLNLDGNLLKAGSISQISNLKKLQNLSLANNELGKPVVSASSPSPEALPKLPESLKQLNLSKNSLSFVPRTVLCAALIRLEKLDLSFNNLASVPEEIICLVSLQELQLDSNVIVSLPEVLGRLNNLKVLSLRDNKITVHGTVFTEKNPQPIPQSIFTETKLIDLNLHGNQMTNTQLNHFEGFQAFLDRRQKVKSKTMTNLDVCGLD